MPLTLRLLLLLSIALIPALPVHAAPSTPTGDIAPNSAVAAPEWTALFDRDSGWTGADGVYTIPLNGDERNGAAAQTSTFFVFSDTFIGNVNPDGSRSGATMINNTMARLYGSAPDPSQLNFYWGTNATGGPASRVLPPAADNWYWPIDGVALRDSLYMFALVMRSDAEDGFAVTGVDLLRSSLRSAEPFSAYAQTSTPLYVAASGSHGDTYYGSAVMPNTVEAGAPHPDGYLYIYGARNDSLSKKLVAARVRPESIENFADYRYWDGHSWQPDIARARALYDRVFGEFSVTPLADGRYLLVFHLDSLSNQVAVSYGASPVGPWGPPITIWTCPEDTMTRSTFTYGSKAHPHLSAPGELLISYHVNTDNAKEVWNNADIYRPRFIKVPLNQPTTAPQSAAPEAVASDADTVLTRIGRADEGGAAAARQADGKLLVAGGGSGGDFVLARYLPDGGFDPAFGVGGVVTTDFSDGSDRATALAVQADGKIVVAGAASVAGRDDFAVARYLPDGALDTTFDGDGKRTIDFAGSDDIANALAVQPDGKLVLAGSALVGGSQQDVALARLNPDGSLDSAFGSSGKVTTDVSGAGNSANAVALQADGRIVVAGANFTGYRPSDDMLALRYTSSGALDTTFDGDGVVTVDFASAGDAARALAIQSDGKIVLAGNAFAPASNDEFALARLNANGSLDTGFSSDGKLTTDFGSYDLAQTLALAPDGDLLVAGRARGATEDFALARYNADGSPDASFDLDGRLTTDFGGGSDEATSVLLLSDARIVLAGKAATGTDDFALARYTASGSLDASFDGDGKLAEDLALGESVAYAVAQQSNGKLVAAGAQRIGRSEGTSFAVARYLASGAVDTAFGNGGVASVDFGAPSEARAVAAQSDGKILVAGRVDSGAGGQMALARLMPDGTLDASFGSGGKIQTAFAEGPSAANALTVGSDGKIILAGMVGSGPTDFAVARYHANGSLDTTFGGDGLVTLDFNAAADAAWTVALQPDGKIVAAGYTYSGATSDFALIRLNTDGSLDTTFDGDGKLTTDFAVANSFAYAVKVLSDGRIVAGGEAETNSGDVALAAYDANGSPDTGFDGDGKLTADLGAREGAHALTITDDGRLLIAGRQVGTDGRDDFLAMRFNSDGSLDTAFGLGGATTVSFEGAEARAYGIVSQADGGVVMAGEAGNFALARLPGLPALDVIISIEGQDVVLAWDMAAPATKCEVWRAAVPYFAPGDAVATLAATVSPCGAGSVTWRDAGRAGDATMNWTYRVRTVGLAAGDVTSSGDGEFDFALVR